MMMSRIVSMVTSHVSVELARACYLSYSYSYSYIHQAIAWIHRVLTNMPD